MKINVEVEILDTDKTTWESELADLQARFPGRGANELVSWALRFYLERVPKMREELKEEWVKHEDIEETYPDLLAVNYNFMMAGSIHDYLHYNYEIDLHLQQGSIKDIKIKEGSKDIDVFDVLAPYGLKPMLLSEIDLGVVTFWVEIDDSWLLITESELEELYKQVYEYAEF